MNMKQWAERLIANRRVAAMPVMTHPGIEKNGNTVRQAVTGGTTHSKAVIALADEYDSAAACTIMDLTVEAEAFGAQVVFTDNAVPAVSSRLLRNTDDIRRLKVPSLDSGRVPQYLKANLLVADAMQRQAEQRADSTDKPRRPLIAGCIGPFSLAGRLYDMAEIMVLICEEPQAADMLLTKCTEFIAKYCEAIKLTGADGVLMAEPAAGLLSDDDCRRFSSDYVRRIVERVQDDNFMVVLHNCGNTGQCTRAMVSSGAAAFHFGNKCDMAEVINDVPPTALAMGNIDPVSIMKDGSPEQVRQAVIELLEKMKPYPNFVLSTGCDTPPGTPAANIRAFFSALEEQNY